MNFKKLSYLCMQKLTNFPYIEDDFDALTNYELLSKIVEYLNEVIANDNLQNDAIRELAESFTNLKNYVDNWLDNVDIEDDVNEKLEQMAQNGSLSNLLSDLYNDLRLEVNQEISSIEDVVDSIVSGTPLVASSTSDMTDTSRVYVNTTDGKWYYYDGDTWEIGGTYQSSGISNNSIDVLMLDNDLQSNFFLDFSTPLEMGDAYTGYYKNDGTLNTDSIYKNYHISLVNGETYVFSGKNISHLASLVILDNSNNLIYQSNPNDTTGNCSYVFKVKENNLTAYISMPTNPTSNVLDFKMIKLRKLNGIYNQLKYDNTINPMMTVEQYFVGATAQLTNTQIIITSFPNTNIDIYPMSKGRTYNVKAWNWSNLCGLYIADLNFDKLYSSSTENIGNTYVEVNYSFTAVKDGYIIISKIVNNELHPCSISITNEALSLQLENVLNGKKIGFDGDSIIKGVGNDNTGYIDIIATNNSMLKSNVSVGGATIATNTFQGDTPRHWICQTVLNIANDCDYVVVNGGFNDYGLSVPMGELSANYTSAVDSTTFYGGLETLCRNLLSRFPTKKIAFITNHNINNVLFNSNGIGLTMQNYIDAIYNTCRKYGIHIIDIGKNTHLSTGIASMATNYTQNGDGIHPNANGYNFFYVDYITSELKNM